MIKHAVSVEYWPNTNQWRIMIAGVAAGYWDNESAAVERAKEVRKALIALSKSEKK
jgi:hypothetical protein